MAMLGRLLCAIVALGSFYGAWWHIADLQRVADERGMVALSLVGRANLRADVGGIFLAIGLFAFGAALRSSRGLAITATLVVACSLAARLISAAIDGAGAETFSPMAIEAITIANLAVAAWALSRKAPEGL